MVNNMDSDDSEIETIDTNSTDSTDRFSESDCDRTTVNSATTATKTITLQMNATGSSHETHCVCRSHLVVGSVVVPLEDRDVVFFARNIWIPEGARCCSHHIIDKRLSRGAVDLIKPMSIRYQEWNSSQIETLLEKFRTLYNGKKRFNFDDPWDLSDGLCSTYPTRERFLESSTTAHHRPAHNNDIAIVDVRWWQGHRYSRFGWNLHLHSKVSEQCVPVKVIQYSQEAVSTETNDDRINDWLYRGMHWFFPLRFLPQRCFDNQERSSRKHGQDVGMD
ncbi:unnamed protein product [Adineta ricciae]|uniref:Uncharacterized protein n=1 Tax=Adineta ricciae TaxID=249248 RepID=A0A815CR22_ADIRI|nr:unnamed protein product [Adineta ricciae]CAF1412776.1 unnamed protein product [Adineta ricciae]